MRARFFTAALLITLLAASWAQAQTNYDDVRIREFPFAAQCWTFRKFTFFETLEKVEALGMHYIQAYSSQTLSAENPDIKFGPDLSDEQIRLVKQKLMQHGISIYAIGVINFENNEASMRKVFDFAKKMGIRIIVTEPAYDDYSLIEKMVKEYNIKIAIHNHPVPSKYARPETPYSRFKGLDERIGVCADTGHWMRSGVDPVEAIRILEGRIIDFHLKDLNDFGTKDTYDVPFGQGKGKIRDVLAEMTLQNYHGCFAIEHEKKEDEDNPLPPLKAGLDYIKSISYYRGYEEILKWSNDRYTKEGWNHSGPGYFELDSKTGILKSTGGMGLFWFSNRMFKDFVLELDYKCQHKFTNSGIFIRCPELVTGYEYIYHTFEVQIDDNSTGIHHTGAVYDAEAPRINAENPTGEWNHFKITFQGGRIGVELNGKTVVDWNAEPSGKIRDFASEGYIGLQNHDWNSSVFFKNIFIKEL